MHFHRISAFRLVCFLACMVAGSQLATAQNSVNTGGGDAEGNGGSASFSVGQVVNYDESQEGYLIYAGVQQPYEISIISGIEENSIQLELVAFPNPASGKLYLKSLSSAPTELRYKLYTNQGKIALSGQILSNNQSVHLANLAPGNYILCIERDQQLIKSFKITKQ